MPSASPSRRNRYDAEAEDDTEAENPTEADEDTEAKEATEAEETTDARVGDLCLSRCKPVDVWFNNPCAADIHGIAHTVVFPPIYGINNH